MVRKCAVCRYKERTCTATCIYYNYLPEETHTQAYFDIESVYTLKAFTRRLQNAEVHHRQSLVDSMARQARALINNPISGWTDQIKASRALVIQHEATINQLREEIAQQKKTIDENDVQRSTYRQVEAECATKDLTILKQNANIEMLLSMVMEDVRDPLLVETLVQKNNTIVEYEVTIAQLKAANQQLAAESASKDFKIQKLEAAQLKAANQQLAAQSASKDFKIQKLEAERMFFKAEEDIPATEPARTW